MMRQRRSPDLPFYVAHPGTEALRMALSRLAHAGITPCGAGHWPARRLRSLRIACDFSCEIRDSCRPTTRAISRRVSSS